MCSRAEGTSHETLSGFVQKYYEVLSFSSSSSCSSIVLEKIRAEEEGKVPVALALTAE